MLMDPFPNIAKVFSANQSHVRGSSSRGRGDKRGRSYGGRGRGIKICSQSSKTGHNPQTPIRPTWSNLWSETWYNLGNPIWRGTWPTQISPYNELYSPYHITILTPFLITMMEYDSLTTFVIFNGIEKDSSR